MLSGKQKGLRMKEHRENKVVDMRDATIARQKAQIAALEDKIKALNLDNTVLILTLIKLKVRASRSRWFNTVSQQYIIDAYHSALEEIIGPFGVEPEDFGLDFDQKKFLEQFAS